MKKITFLIMFLLGLNLATSQNTNTNLTKCYSPEQVNEIYKGLKQGEYLKEKLSKTEQVLDQANNLIIEQKSINTKLTSALNLSEQVTLTNQEVYSQDKKIDSLKYNTLDNDFQMYKIQSKKEKRKSLWTGIKIGGISVGILTTAAFIFLK